MAAENFVLSNAQTGSIALNQLSVLHSGMENRILSMPGNKKSKK